ncbi:MAG TPA: surface-adhesin E family protein [Steroidobacteraceae bacterium]|nr:surface-adhesin E family protein [Steroidobacteraceae bacterium]
MTPTISRRHGPALLLAACLAQNSLVAGQTPEQQKMWDEQRTQMQAQEKVNAERLAKEREARRADPMAWVRTLDPMTSGGWVFKEVGTDGSWATFGTEHQLKRSGHLVTEWLRQEYPEPHRSPAGGAYLSDVEKVQYDCAKERARVLLVIYYADNNLAGGQQTEEPDPKQIDWDPIVPGTRSEYIFHWTCGAGSTGARPR